MPTVPTYDSFQVAPTTNPNVQVQAPEFNNVAIKQQGQQAEALVKSASMASRVAADMQSRANAIRVEEARSEAQEAAMALRFAKPTRDEKGDEVDGGFESIRGESALKRKSGMPLADEYLQKFHARTTEIEQRLGNDAQRQMFRQHANQIGSNLHSGAMAHESKQFFDYTNSVHEGAVKNSANAIIIDPTNVENVSVNITRINDIVYQNGKLKGHSAAEIESTQREAVSQTHLSAIKRMVSADGSETSDGAKLNADLAIQYFKQYKDQMSGVSRTEADNIVSAAGSYLTGVKASDEIWGKVGPKGINAPVDLFKMERMAREMFPDSPNKQKSTIAELRSRAQSFNSTQSEYTASNMDAVGKLMLNGVSEEKLKTNPSFLALGGVQQNQIVEHLNARNASDRVRAEQELQYRSAGKYFELSDPLALTNMSRAEVQNLLPTLGVSRTSELLNRWDSLQNKDFMVHAKMDKQQFDTLADQFGYRPYEKDKSEDDKRKLGVLHQSVNEALSAASRQKGKALTDDEKATVMREQMARTVKVKGWFALEHGSGFFADDKPAFALDGEDRRNVYIPQGTRQRIVGEMKKNFDRTKDSVFAPTEDNIVFWYLQGVKKGDK